MQRWVLSPLREKRRHSRSIERKKRQRKRCAVCLLSLLSSKLMWFCLGRDLLVFFMGWFSVFLVKRAEDETARLYAEFVESFQGDNAPGSKTFVRGGTINPNEKLKSDAEGQSEFWLINIYMCSLFLLLFCFILNCFTQWINR